MAQFLIGVLINHFELLDEIFWVEQHLLYVINEIKYYNYVSNILTMFEINLY